MSDRGPIGEDRTGGRLLPEELSGTTEMLFRTMFEQAPVGITVVDARTGRYLIANATFCRIIGRDERDVVGATHGDITHPEDKILDAEYMRRLLAGEIESYNFEKRYLRRDGAIVWVDLTVVPLSHPTGPVLNVLAITVDISDRKRLDEQMIQLNREVAESQMATIFALAALAESRDDETGRHIQSVQVLCRMIAESMRNDQAYSRFIDDEYVELLVRACPLHDVGKVAIADHILLKPGPLNEEETVAMHLHAAVGADTLDEVRNKYPHNEFIATAVDVARYHHERWDGTGYPDGLSGQWIPLSARIMAVADVYEALRSRRVYKGPFSHEESVRMIEQGAGTQFDPSVVAALVRVQDRLAAVWDKAT